jgi:hypothetical protein
MTPQQKKVFKRLVKRVPDELKAEAASKVKFALENGWTNLYYWDSRKPHPADLFGINPVGKTDVLPNPTKQGLYDD